MALISKIICRLLANDKTDIEHIEIIFENLSKASFYFWPGSDELPNIVLAFFVHLKLKVAAIMLSLVSEIWFIAISITVSIDTVVAHHLQNVSG